MYLSVSGLHKMVDSVLLQSSTCGGCCIDWRRRNVHLCRPGASSWQGKEKWVGGPYVSEQSLAQFFLADATFCRGHHLGQKLLLLMCELFVHLCLLLSTVFLSLFEAVSSPLLSSKQGSRSRSCCGWDQVLVPHRVSMAETIADSPSWRGFVNHCLRLCATLQHRVIAQVCYPWHCEWNRKEYSSFSV